MKALESKVTAHSHVLSDEFGASDILPEEEDIIDDFLHNANEPMYSNKNSPPVVSTGNRRRASSSSSSIGSNRNGGGRSLTQRLLSELKQQLHDCEQNVERTNLIALEAYQASTGKKYKPDALGFLRKTINKPSTSKNRTIAQTDSDSDDNDNNDITLQGQHKEVKSLNKRVKLLGDNTSKACRSLSVGLTDVQQATLFLYAWCDKAHDAFGVLSAQLGMSSNICPRVQVYRQKSQNATSQLDAI